MKSYIKDLNLMDVVEIEEPGVHPLRVNATLNEIKKYDELVTKSLRALTCIHSSLMDLMSTRIMTCQTTKEAWDKLKEEIEGRIRVKSVRHLGLKREFEILKMKDSDSAKEYSSKLMEIVNQIRILGISEDQFQARNKLKHQKESRKVLLDKSGETNHLEKNCWQNSKRYPIQCRYCNKYGHLENYCRQNQNKNGQSSHRVNFEDDHLVGKSEEEVS
uniref:Uncharacterized protein n=1 Tax=Solanum lycopersicum TaxID=4081 RepID=A0A3Q7IF84_SOLLC